jgi:phosphoribosylformimino-5-aminoimidazole carboxamide ribotide isomerase
MQAHGEFPMLLIPAINLKDGKCVRLTGGDPGKPVRASEDPVAAATRWIEAGAKRLHVVDLDGACAGEPTNADAIHAIAEAFGDVQLQVGGGIRNEETVQAYLDAGVDWVIIGTRAVTTPHFINDLCLEFPEHIMVGLDSRDGRLAIDGWSKLSTHDLLDTARHLERDGVAAFVFTDIERDGLMQGLNVAATVELAQAVTVPVFASGGVKDMEDVRALSAADEENLAGIIVGRALYEGKFDLAEAQRLADSLAD